MGLSDYDLLAFTHEAKSCNGIFISPTGITVEFYKNWLYLRDPKAWREGFQFVTPTVMEIRHGELVYGDVHILAFRGPQRGIYAAIWSGYGNSLTGMIGCAVRGFDPETKEWIGTQPESLRWFQEKVIAGKNVSWPCLQQTFSCWDFDEELPDELRWVLLLGDPLRFNQGDAYLTRLVDEVLPVTKLGEAETPHLIQALKNK